ncbi:MAG TPA: LamG-like jellyroll fold domain-containing protein [Verrucomicrobiae bacterium]|jgi:hypothetical protein|nr:LamG-like jellyroll fold domain-containing protein [Verrucomicrobiae bacterium]
MKLYRAVPGGASLALVIGSLLFFTNPLATGAQTNSWLGTTSGNWEDSSWSLGVLPGPGQNILFTNAGWKALSIGLNTANNFPQTLTVGSITVSSPTNSFNTLLLNYVGAGSPLVADSLTLNENSTMTLYSSALQVHSNMSIGGTFNQKDFSGVSAARIQIGDVGPAAYTMDSGTLTVTNFEVIGGWGNVAVFDQQGGYHFATPLRINAGGGEYDLRGGQLGGDVQMTGGVLNQYDGDLRVSGFAVDGFYNLFGGTIEAPNGFTAIQGYVTQNGGTNTSGPLLLGSATDEGDPLDEGPGFYTLSNGVLNVTGNATVNFLANLDQEGGAITINGALNLPYFFTGPSPGFYLTGSFTLGGGTFSADSINYYGTITQSGGTNNVAGDLVSQFYPASYSLSGGLLTTSNTLVGTGGGGVPFHQSGGAHVVQNLLRVTSVFGYNMTGGELIAPNIDIGGSSFTHAAGTISNSDLITLESANWFEQTPNQQFGRLQLSAAGTVSILALSTSPCTVRFADSSGQSWSNNATLQIENWAGVLTGGGQSQLIFGNNAGGLSAGQLARIQFHFSQGNFPAKILSSGEVVPDASGSPFLPTDLGAAAISSNQISLLWTDNSINETGYGIERSLDGSNFVQIATAPANATNYSDTSLAAATHYYYRIRALGADGNSDYSNIALATTKLGTPPPVAGMIAWWRGEGTAEDAIGAHDGHVPWDIDYPTGKVGQAFDFPGLGQRVVIPDSPDFVLTNAFSIEGWIYPRQPTSGFITTRGDGRPGLDTWTVHMEHIPGYLSFAIDSESNDFVQVDAPVQINQWQHFAATFDVTNGLKLYINGALAAQTNTTLIPVGILDPTLEPSIGIGNSGVSSDEFSFDGMIDELALYSRALTPAEIQRIYNGGAAGKLGMPQVMALGRQPSGAMQLNFAGFAGRNYEFDVSTDLVHWTSWTTQLNDSGTMSIMDNEATNYPTRFYRAVLLP